jgi:hypothetical protein
MRLIIAVKRIAAMVLLVAFFLPLAQCTVMTTKPGKVSEPVVDVTYAYATYDEEFPTPVLAYVGFLWPLAFAIAGLLRPKLLRHRGVALIEMTLCVGSAYVLYMLVTLGGDIRYGAYVAATAIGLYFVSASADVAIRWRAALRSG